MNTLKIKISCWFEIIFRIYVKKKINIFLDRFFVDVQNLFIYSRLHLLIYLSYSYLLACIILQICIFHVKFHDYKEYA